MFWGKKKSLKKILVLEKSLIFSQKILYEPCNWVAAAKASNTRKVSLSLSLIFSIAQLRTQFNPSSPKSEQSQVSPSHIHTSLSEKGVRIDIIISKGKNDLIYYRILLANYLRKCVEISLENLYADIGAEKVNNLAVFLPGSYSLVVQCV